MERIPHQAQEAIEQARLYATQAAEVAQARSQELRSRAVEATANVSEGARQFLSGVTARFSRLRGETPALPTDNLPVPTSDEATPAMSVERARAAVSTVVEKTGTAAVAARKGAHAAHKGAKAAHKGARHAVEKAHEKATPVIARGEELAQGARERVQVVFGTAKDRLSEIRDTATAKTPESVKKAAKAVGEYYTDEEKGKQRKAVLAVAVGTAAVATTAVIIKRRHDRKQAEAPVATPEPPVQTPEPPKPKRVLPRNFSTWAPRNEDWVWATVDPDIDVEKHDKMLTDNYGAIMPRKQDAAVVAPYRQRLQEEREAAAAAEAAKTAPTQPATATAPNRAQPASPDLMGRLTDMDGGEDQGSGETTRTSRSHRAARFVVRKMTEFKQELDTADPTIKYVVNGSAQPEQQTPAVPSPDTQQQAQQQQAADRTRVLTNA